LIKCSICSSKFDNLELSPDSTNSSKYSLESGRQCEELALNAVAKLCARLTLNVENAAQRHWFRRGYGSGAGHAEHQFARKSTGSKVTANDSSYALAA
jgi:hypothetical protein